MPKSQEWKAILRVRAHEKLLRQGKTLTDVSAATEIGYATLLNLINPEDPSFPRGDVLMTFCAYLGISMDDIAVMCAKERFAAHHKDWTPIAQSRSQSVQL